MKESDQYKIEVVNNLIRLLYSGATVSICASVLTGILLCISQQDVIAHTVLVFWFIPFFIISSGRIWLLYHFHKITPPDTNLDSWHRYFLIGTFLAGIMWGVATIFLCPGPSPQHQSMFYLIIIAVTAVGITSLSSSIYASVGFISIILLSLATRLLILDSERHVLFGSLVLIYWLVSLLIAKQHHMTLSNNIKLTLQSIARGEELKKSEERYRHVFNNAPVGIIQYNAKGIVVNCNEYLVELLGSTRERVMGLNLLNMLKEKKVIHSIKESLTKGKGYFEGDYKSVTGTKKTPIRAFFKALRAPDASIMGGVGIVEDFTDKKRFEEKIYYHASYDFLTTLPNRRLLNDKLSEEISRACRHGYFAALLFLDLDNFKNINDSLGHSVGDNLLKLVAKRIKKCIREEDIAARMGGDEFVIILTELGASMDIAASNAGVIAEEIRLCLSSPCKINEFEIHTGVSVGVSIFPKPDKSVDDILKQADTAMYSAKADGRNTIRFFSPTMQQKADDRLQINFEIKNALNNDEFVLYYQPQVDHLGNLVGAEALIRWNHPERGLLLPGVFLQIAEETGLLADIGNWVMQSACQQIKEWTDAKLLPPSLSISINISGKELMEPDFVNTVKEILARTNADPSHLGIELTEGSLISTNEEIIDQIIILQKLGIKISVDDFGTGYSSLSYLNKLPINTLKIDRSFVNEINDIDRQVILVDTIILMAENLGLEIIAEGVESAIERNYLKSKGCIIYQGHYFSKSIPVNSFTPILESSLSGPFFNGN